MELIGIIMLVAMIAALAMCVSVTFFVNDETMYFCEIEDEFVGDSTGLLKLR